MMMSGSHLRVSEPLFSLASGHIEVEFHAVEPVSVVEGILRLGWWEYALVLVQVRLTKIL